MTQDISIKVEAHAAEVYFIKNKLVVSAKIGRRWFYSAILDPINVDA